MLTPDTCCLSVKGVLEQNGLFSARSDGNENNLGFNNLLKSADICLSLRRQVGEFSHIVKRLVPTFHVLVNRLSVLHYLQTRGKIVYDFAVITVSRAYRNFLETR